MELLSNTKNQGSFELYR